MYTKFQPPLQALTTKIVLFDGVCNLCNHAVQFIIKRDKRNQFRFASLQGKVGEEILAEFGLSSSALNSFILIDEHKVYLRSDASLRIAKHLGGGWQLLYGLMIVPAFIRNGIYNFIANHRYKWFGRTESCWLPKPEWQSKFLD